MAVYFIRDASTGRVKIGHGRDPWRRLTMLQTGCPGELTLLAIIEGGEATERELHERFAEHRARGEWFHYRGALGNYLDALPAPRRPRTKTQAFWDGLKTDDVARLTGLSPSYLSQISNGVRRPSPENAILIQRACGVSAIKLVFGALAKEAA